MSDNYDRHLALERDLQAMDAEHEDECNNCGAPLEGGECVEDCEGDYLEDDGQPTEYEEYQDLYGGDDWDHGQFDEY